MSMLARHLNTKQIFIQNMLRARKRRKQIIHQTTNSHLYDTPFVQNIRTYNFQNSERNIRNLSEWHREDIEIALKNNYSSWWHKYGKEFKIDQLDYSQDSDSENMVEEIALKEQKEKILNNNFKEEDLLKFNKDINISLL